jgi:hypothetical protein
MTDASMTQIDKKADKNTTKVNTRTKGKGVWKDQ